MSINRWRTRKRLPQFDYRLPGPYWVTICLYNRLPRFGTVDCEGVKLSDQGLMIDEAWTSLTKRFPTVTLDAYIVMPDHVHGILSLNDGTNLGLSESPSLVTVIGAFKNITTIQYIAGVKALDWPPHEKYFWLEDYNEHVIRNDADLEEKRLYVERNPSRWLEKRAARQVDK